MHDDLAALVKGNQGPSSFTWGLRYSVWCAEEMPFEDPARVASQVSPASGPRRHQRGRGHSRGVPRVERGARRRRGEHAGRERRARAGVCRRVRPGHALLRGAADCSRRCHTPDTSSSRGSEPRRGLLRAAAGKLPRPSCAIRADPPGGLRVETPGCGVWPPLRAAFTR
ncbi:MAG: hypothetical protein MZV70_07890 [Desulfobacterales bacterium]|nr:hypothetical protein [Desulfobacterales bacterium]